MAAGLSLNCPSCRGGWGERPSSGMAIHSVAVDRTPNLPTGRRTLYHWANNDQPDVPKPQSLLYVGDFNCQHVNWVYSKISPDGKSLDSWATSNNLGLSHGPKETTSFFHRWNVSTNLGLAFASFCQGSRLPDRRVLGKFPRAQRRHSLIKPPKLKVPAHGDPVKRRKLRKVDWKCFFLLTGESVERLPP